MVLIVLVEVNILGHCFCNLALWHSLLMCIVLPFVPCVLSVLKSQTPALFKRNTFPQVMMPPSHLSPIDFRLACALQGVWKLVKAGTSDRFRVKESGDAGTESVAKTDIY